jgi:hypothetical protein
MSPGSAHNHWIHVAALGCKWILLPTRSCVTETVGMFLEEMLVVSRFGAEGPGGPFFTWLTLSTSMLSPIRAAQSPSAKWVRQKRYQEEKNLSTSRAQITQHQHSCKTSASTPIQAPAIINLWLPRLLPSQPREVLLFAFSFSSGDHTASLKPFIQRRRQFQDIILFRFAHCNRVCLYAFSSAHSR